MNDAPADLATPGFAEPKRDEGWPLRRWLLVIALIFTAHVALIFLFGSKKPIAPRAVANVPALKFADDSGNLPALNNPALFALPNPEGFAAAVWQKTPAVEQPSFRWSEPPRSLPLPADSLGTTLSQFVQLNFVAGIPPDFKPPARLSVPALPVEPAFAQNSTLQIEGGLARRKLLSEINLPSLPNNDVIAPTVVRVLVDAAGSVVSAVVLPPESSLEAAGRYDPADQHALELARQLRFAPASQLTFGIIIFNWHTVPLAATNAAASPP
ncbi:MAG TPA: hypothetical protein VMD27_05780 [Candidatus Aquilonibacter sp.]|nr:hypothetical protein [Candidatus Aquilonibacter sp.]